MATVIGPNTCILGGLAGKDDLIIEGTVDGAIEGEASVTLAVGARVGGPVRGRDVTIAGELDHPVFATGTARLLATARVTGDIEASGLSIEEGATFDGQIRMRRKSASASAPAPVPAPPAPTPISAIREIPELAAPGRRRLIRKT